MTVMITGGTGFLGSFVARELCDRGESPVLMDVNPALWRLRGYESRVRLYDGSVTSWADVVQAVRDHGVSKIVHAAADLSLKAERMRVESFRTNLEATLTILEVARLFDIERVVFVSSLSVLGERSMPVSEHSFRDPSTFYGATKAASEVLGQYYSKAHGLEFVTIRFPTISGPYRRGEGASVTVSSFIDDAVARGRATLTLPPETRIPLLYVKDAAKLIRMVLEAPGVLSDIYIAGGVVISVGELVEHFRKIVPEAEVEFRIDDTSRKIAEEWMRLTEMAVRNRLVERHSSIEEFGWSIEFDSAEKMVRDHVDTLLREVT